MKEQILALLEEVKGKLVVELQKKETFESEKQQLLQEIESLNAQIVELQMQLAQYEAQDAEILARAQELNDMLPASLIIYPYPVIVLSHYDVPYFIAQNVNLVVSNGEVRITNNSDFPYTATIDGVEFNISFEPVVLGNVNELDGSHLTVKNQQSNATYEYHLIYG